LEDLARQGKSFVLYSGAPLTGAVALSKDVKDRVVYIAAMFGSLDDGSKNLLGGNFNTVVAFRASLQLVQGLDFPNARVVFFPTNFFKTKEQVCTYTAEELEGLAASLALKWLAAHVAQWTGLKRGQTQPLFDPAVLVDLPTVALNFKLFEAKVVLGPNVYAKETPFEAFGLRVAPNGPKKWLGVDSPFPVGFYSVDAEGLGPESGAETGAESGAESGAETGAETGAEGGNFEAGARGIVLSFLRGVFASA
jgi:hypothetical protein